MEIILTGALGHIGSYLMRNLRLLDESATFIAVDNLGTERYSSLFNLQQGKVSHFFSKDLTEGLDFLKPYRERASLIIHLAALNNMDKPGINEEVLEQNNLGGTRNIINFAQENSIPILFPSSTSVYGISGMNLREDSQLGESENAYARVKKMEEDLMNNFFSTGGKGIILRLGTIHGVSTGMRFHTAVNKFCFQVKQGLPIEVWQTALDQYRPYLAIDDFSRLVRHIIENRLYQGGTFNVATANYTVRDLLILFREIMEKDLDISLIESERMNHLDIGVSCEKVKETGFKFEGDVRRDIAETLSLLGVIYAK